MDSIIKNNFIHKLNAFYDERINLGNIARDIIRQFAEEHGDRVEWEHKEYDDENIFIGEAAIVGIGIDKEGKEFPTNACYVILWHRYSGLEVHCIDYISNPEVLFDLAHEIATDSLERCYELKS